MEKSLFTKEQYINELNSIIENNSLGVDDIIKRLSALVPHNESKEKCPEISSEDLKNGIETLTASFWEFVKIEDVPLYDNKDTKVYVNFRNLAEIVNRVYKRKEYYRYFHNIDHVSELKETALNCFWIIKLKPFTVLVDDSPLKLSVNEKFALNLILSQIQYLLNEKGRNFHMPDKCFIQDTLYAFKYRDLSKEAMILFVDSIANAYGLTIDSWI